MRFQLRVAASLAAAWAGAGLHGGNEALAAPLLPYTTRTHEYSAWGTTVNGDLATVGMAGAMVGLGDSRIGSVDNPAGIPLTLDSTGLQVAGNTVRDGHIQSYDSLITTSSTVISYCPYPWGASFASWSPVSEGDTYQVGDTTQNLFVRTREYHFSAAHLFLNDRLSIGLTGILGENSQRFTPEGGGTIDHTAWGLGARIGVLYALPRRVLLGMTFTPPISYSMDGATGDMNPGIANFFQDARSPYRLALGAGWLPNRFFKLSMGLYIFGPTANTALLSDDSKLVGENTTFQPRLGVAYKAFEYKELRIELAAGTYLETMRTEGDPSRIHGTFALEIKPWVLTFGWGIDHARHYQNFIYSAGVDLGRLMSKLELIPPQPQFPQGGAFPKPTHFSDAGLGHALDSSWKQPDDNVIEIGKRMPRQLKKRFDHAPEDAVKFGTDVIDTFQNLPGNIQEESVQIWKRSMGEESDKPGDKKPE